MYGIYGIIYHQYTPNVSIYTIHMDPMLHIIPGNSAKLPDRRELPPTALPR